MPRPIINVEIKMSNITVLYGIEIVGEIEVRGMWYPRVSTEHVAECTSLAVAIETAISVAVAEWHNNRLTEH